MATTRRLTIEDLERMEPDEGRYQVMLGRCSTCYRQIWCIVRKINALLAAGVRPMWFVNPNWRPATAYRPGQPPFDLDTDQA